MLTLPVVVANAKDGTMAILHMDKPDSDLPDSVQKYKTNVALRAGLAALKQQKIAGGNPTPQIFATPGAEKFYNDKSTYATVKESFNNLDTHSPFFPFAATLEVSDSTIMCVSVTLTLR